MRISQTINTIFAGLTVSAFLSANAASSFSLETAQAKTGSTQIPASVTDIAPESSPKTVEIKKDIIKKKYPIYIYNLDQISKEVDENLKKVNLEIRGRKKEQQAIEHYETGNRSYEEGDLEKAREEWEKVRKITREPQTQEFMRRTKRRDKEIQAQKEKRARELERAEEKARREAEKRKIREQKRLEREKKTAEKKKAQELKRRKAAEEKARRAAEKKKLREQKKQEREQKIAEKKKAHELKRRKAAEKNARRLDESRQKPDELKEREEPQGRASEKKGPIGDEVPRIYNEGLKFYNAKEYDEALEKFKKVRELSPGYAKTAYYFHVCDYMVRAHENNSH